MADVVLDANVLVGLLDRNDTLHDAATGLVKRIAASGDIVVLIDFCVAEALSVLCRRGRERKSNPPDLTAIFEQARALYDAGKIARIEDQPFNDVLDVMQATSGALNYNDALLVLLQRRGTIGDVASFDVRLDVADGFRRLA
jgi:predicted nucleic acid-binding protein